LIFLLFFVVDAALEVEAAGGKALAIECDIRNDEQIHRAVQQVSKKNNIIRQIIILLIVP
jgi:NAD(P)-dependent dehydrogenase (short-subunit alcohol dehydrogenase family)